MRTLTSLSKEPRIGGRCATLTELQERTGASLVCTSSAEPLNAVSSVGLSSVSIGEEKSNPGTDQEWANSPRVPVVDSTGNPLMPCKPARARLLLKQRRAIAKRNKLGIFYIQLKRRVEQKNQPLAVGVDPGSKFEAVSIVGTEDTVLNIMSEATDWVKKAVETRRKMRRARRYRNTRRRPCRIDNRSPHQNRIPPSTKARWDTKLRIVTQLKKIIPITTAVVEDIKAETRKGQRRWNRNFSPLEVGKQYFCSQLRSTGLKVETRTGTETRDLREKFILKKISDKSRPVFESHCVDAWCLAASITGAHHPTTKGLYYIVPLRWHRRQLHRLEPDAGGIRRRYGGTVSLSFKKGTLVKHVKYGLCYVGGTLKGRISLHDLKTGRRLAQNAKIQNLKALTRIAFRTQFFPSADPETCNSSSCPKTGVFLR
jgi:hypothetical protein